MRKAFGKKASADALDALADLLVETDQHATGACPKLLAACKRARAVLALARAAR
jgi:hypothetical protein